MRRFSRSAATTSNRTCVALVSSASLIALSHAAEPVVAAGASSASNEEVIIIGKSVGRTKGGTKSTAPLRQTPSTLTVFDRERIEEQNLLTLEDLATVTPGVTITGVGSEGASFMSRGFAIDNYLTDGVPGTAGYSTLIPDLFLFDRVEVLRGPAGLFSGAGNPAGSINLVRKRPLDEARLTASVSYGRWNNYRAELDVSTPLSANGAIKARAGTAFHDQDQFYDVAHRRRLLTFGVLSFDFDDATTLTVGGHYEHFEPAIQTGLPGYRYGADRHPTGLLSVRRSTYLGADWNSRNAKVTSGFAELRHEFADGWVGRASLAYTKTDNYDFYAYIGSQPVLPEGSAPNAGRTSHIIYFGDSEGDALSADVNLIGAFEAFGQTHDLVIGADYQTRNPKTLAYGRLSNVTFIDVYNPDTAVTRYPVPSNGADESETVQYGVYGQARIRPMENLTLVLGGRLSWWDYSAVSTVYPTATAPTTRVTYTAYDQKGEFTPFAGIVYDVTDNVTLYASYADVFQPQSQKTFENEQIDPLIGHQYEAGVKVSLADDRLLVSAAVYQLEQSNRAYSDPEHEGFFIAAGTVEARGGEFEVSGKIASNWSLSAGYSYTESKTTKDANPNSEGRAFQPIIPKHAFKAWTNYEFEDGSLAGLSLGAGVNYVGAARGGSPGALVASGIGAEVRQRGYAVFNARVGYEIDDNLSVNLNVNNVFDKIYYARISATGRGNFYGEPRSFMISLRATY